MNIVHFNRVTAALSRTSGDYKNEPITFAIFSLAFSKLVSVDPDSNLTARSVFDEILSLDVVEQDDVIKERMPFHVLCDWCPS